MRGHSTTCWSLVRGWHSFHRRHHCLVVLEPSWCNCPQLKVFYYSSTPKCPLPVCRTKRSSNFLKKNDMDQSYACNMCLLNCWYFWGIYWQFIFHLDLRREIISDRRRVIRLRLYLFSLPIIHFVSLSESWYQTMYSRFCVSLKAQGRQFAIERASF